ncbi:predicted protein [Plenodomus lingam JN3]|uniref:Predicted protein n=1 Tax=Leptosphaeria maculans (strain JN3 / isolate v23.1.3 / race Av1-4-5-6-7-8) TaxID=985895 RepID=E5A1G8_LEPMJ|nr:predicted protein [Plenodomus lingam JN3]CBX97432.1 predicted protein [Plenodomus lingam JN3]
MASFVLAAYHQSGPYKFTSANQFKDSSSRLSSANLHNPVSVKEKMEEFLTISAQKHGTMDSKAPKNIGV